MEGWNRPTTDDGLIWEDSPGPLRRPVLVAAFEGWNDAADAATLRRRSGSPGTATARARRPHRPRGPHRLPGPAAAGASSSTASPGRSRGRSRRSRSRATPSATSWCSAASSRRTGGSRSAARCSTSATATGCEMVVTFGALLADVPHTREVRVTGTATDPELIAATRRSSRRATRARPGSSACCTTRAAADGIPSVSLWAPVPHYIASPPNPPASLGHPRAVRPADRHRRSTSAGCTTHRAARGASRSTRSRPTTTTSELRQAARGPLRRGRRRRRARGGLGRRAPHRRRDRQRARAVPPRPARPAGRLIAHPLTVLASPGRVEAAQVTPKGIQASISSATARHSCSDSASDSTSTRSSLPWNIVA